MRLHAGTSGSNWLRDEEVRVVEGEVGKEIRPRGFTTY